MTDNAPIPGFDGTDRDPRRHAMVLSGGGAKGAFEVGVMKALFSGASSATGQRPVRVGQYTGTSVGAYNATYMVSRGAIDPRVALADLEAIWRQEIAATRIGCGNGIYRLRGAPLQLLDPGCLLHPLSNALALGRDGAFLSAVFATKAAQFVTSDEPPITRLLDTIDVGAFFDVTPLRELTESSIDFAALAASPLALTIIASDWVRGLPIRFDREEIALRLQAQAVLASTAIPGLFPPVPLDDTIFVDGGVTENTPFVPAIEAGARVLHVVFLDPLVQNVPFPTLPSTIDTVYRLYAILIGNAVDREIQRVRLLNQGERMLARLEGRGLLAAARDELARVDGIGEVLGLRDAGEPHRPIEIHKYRPETDLGGAEGLLDFREPTVDRLIEDGFANAAAHDCSAEGCVIPGGDDER